MNILIIEDDLLLGKRISEVFYGKVIANKVHLIHSFQGFLDEYVSIGIYDMILTDLNLGNYKDPEGFEIIKKIREYSKTIPIIVISGYDDIEKLRYSFSLGISDYIVKPVRLKELEVRVLNWFHTYYSTKLAHSGKIFTYKVITFDIDQNIFFHNDLIIDLSKNNKYLLSLFFSHPEKILSEKFLGEKIWGDRCFLEKRNIRIPIMRLKKKLAPYGLDGWIQNIHSEGYVFKEITYSSI